MGFGDIFVFWAPNDLHMFTLFIRTESTWGLRKAEICKLYVPSCISLQESLWMCQLLYTQIKTYTIPSLCLLCLCTQLLKTSDAWTCVPWGPGLIRDNKKHLDGGHKNSLLMRSCEKSKHKESEKKGWRVRKESLRDTMALFLSQHGLSYKYDKIRATCSLYFVPILLIWKSDDLSFPSASRDDTWVQLIKWLLSVILLCHQKMVKGKRNMSATENSFAFRHIETYYPCTRFRYFRWIWMDRHELWYRYPWSPEDESYWLWRAFDFSSIYHLGSHLWFWVK